MKKSFLVLLVTCAAAAGPLHAQVEDEDNLCIACHGNSDIWEDETKHLHVTAEDLAGDIHWQKGVRCQDCHGGDPTTFDLRTAHAIEDGFRKIESPADLPKFCGHCHSNADYMQKFSEDAPLDTVERFVKSVHGTYQPDDPDGKIVSCTSCHPTHTMRAVDDPLSACHPARLNQTCGACHEQQATLVAADVHGQPTGQDTGEKPEPLNCNHCHGDDVHGMVAVSDHNSPVFVNHQVETCGGCHEQAYEEYRVSVHGHGLENSGLLTTAVCSSCHGAHGVHPATNEKSLLYPTNVDATCATCHRFIGERLAKSVHGRGGGPGGVAEETSPGGDSQRNPTCTDCHQGHDQPHPSSERFRLTLHDRCGNCHADLEEGFKISMHGELTVLGYGPAAQCSDCHGAHDILPISDPASRLSEAHRMQTCQQCHPGAVQNFLAYDPHTDHRDRERYPVENTIYMVLLTFIVGTFGFFGVHSVLWLARGLVEVFRDGRPAMLTPGAPAVVRFRQFHRIAHTFMLISFLGLALTGLPLKFSQSGWAQVLAQALGGFESTGLWHRIFGLVNVGCLVLYLLLMLSKLVVGRFRGKPTLQVVFGPDSPVPNLRDFKDFVKMVRWFVGAGPKPTFERWAYWEKFDFWGASADIVIIGTTGLILWFPNFFCSFLPGQTLAVSKVIHSTQALLATGFVFAIHFFSTHFRPDKFPMDMSVLTGLVTDEEMRHERPDYYERLEREGKLEEMKTTVPGRGGLWLRGLGGLVGLLIGLGLLVAMIVAGLSG
jgi:cytochrome b subunit of formate dehydrogenase